MKDSQVHLQGNVFTGWRIRTRRGDFVVLPRSEFEGAKTLQRCHISGSPEIMEWARDAILWPSLIEMYEAIRGRRILHPLRTEVAWLSESIYDAFRSGELVLTPSDWQLATFGGGEPREGSEPPEEEAKPAPTQVEEKEWFRARLLDEDGTPMAGEDYVLTDSTGARREGKLDASGEVYIPAILPHGDCTINFPKIHLNPRKRK